MNFDRLVELGTISGQPELKDSYRERVKAYFMEGVNCLVKDVVTIGQNLYDIALPSSYIDPQDLASDIPDDIPTEYLSPLEEKLLERAEQVLPIKYKIARFLGLIEMEFTEKEHLGKALETVNKDTAKRKKLASLQLASKLLNN